MPPTGQRSYSYTFITICTLATISLVIIPVLCLTSVRSWISENINSATSTLSSPTEQQQQQQPQSLESQLASTPLHPFEMTTFGSAQDEILESLKTKDDEAWASALLPHKSPFLMVRYNATYPIGYGVSMFHGLHCLQMLRKGLQSLVRIKGGGEMGENEHGSLEDEERHYGHCVQYVAELLRCGGDGTLEPPHFDRDRDGNIIRTRVDGTGVKHTCKNNDVLWDVMAKSAEAPLEEFEWSEGLTVQQAFGGKNLHDKLHEPRR